MNDHLIRMLFLGSLTWGILLAAYTWIGQDGQPTERRIYLLMALAAGAVLPWIECPWPAGAMTTFTLPVMSPSAWPVPASLRDDSAFLPGILAATWMSGAGWTLIRLAWGLSGLHRLNRGASHAIIDGERVRFTASIDTPFQFMFLIFLPELLRTDPSALRLALAHESAHRHLGHSLDLFLTLVLRTVFWFHPFVHRLIRELRLVHEFEADRLAVRRLDLDEYARFLGSFRSRRPVPAFVQTFNHPPVKRRIMQLYLPSRRWGAPQLATFLFLFLLLAGTTAFSGPDGPVFRNGQDTRPVTDSLPPEQGMAVDEVVDVADDMPRFPGCEDQASDLREACAVNKLMTWIANNLTYPEEARTSGLEGTNVVSFIVEKDGTVDHFRLIRDIGGGTGEAVLAMMKQMRSQNLRWIPGRKDCRTVRVEMKLPVRFAMEVSTKGKG